MSLFDDPRQGRVATGLLLSLLTFIAFLMRWNVSSDVALDSDALSFGLAAFRFDLLSHQPHPPGYPGYVLLLKAIHLMAPSLSPIQVASMGSHFCGAALVPASFLAVKTVSPSRRTGFPYRPFIASTLAAFHPLLWYYGSDGQSHTAEALVSVLLFAACAASVPSSGRSRVLLLTAAFAMAGSIRPTIPLLGIPLLLWPLLRRPLVDWFLAALVAIGITALWFIPLLAMSGGWESYARTSVSLYRFYSETFSVFGDRATFRTITININNALWGFLIAGFPMLLWSFSRRSAWQLAILITTAWNLLFYLVVYTAEPGYLSMVAGFSCLAPASWAPRINSLRRALGVVALSTCPALFIFLPATVPMLGVKGDMIAPSLGYVEQINQAQNRYIKMVKTATQGESALVVTDNLNITQSRQLPQAFPSIRVAIFAFHHPLSPGLSAMILIEKSGFQNLPTRIPLEPGSVGTLAVPMSPSLLIISHDSSRAFFSLVTSQSRCEPVLGAPGLTGPSWPKGMLVYPIRCMPELVVGNNRLILRQPR